MTAPTPRLWQLAAGPARRSYAELLQSYALALVGPGDPGPWRPGRADEEFGGAAVRLLAQAAGPGDAIVLREGAAKILSIGLVAGPYRYLPQFDDVNGWDLQHARRVRWGPHAPYTFGEPLFGTATPAFGPVTQAALIDYAARFLAAPLSGWRTAPLPPLPPDEEPIYDPPPALAGLVGLARDLVPLYADALRFGDPPAEHELVAHFVVPLLRGLGWQPEQIALEWRRIDVAVFRRLPRTAQNLAFVVEAKRPHRGVESHLQQAQDYLNGLGVQRDVVVTDGLRYRLYAADCGYTPVAYANLERLKPSGLALFERLACRPQVTHHAH